MDIMNVYVIFDKKHTKESIVREIELEGYKHNFCFGKDLEYHEKIKNIKIAQEIWVFGDVDRFEDMIYARSIGKDIWRMG